MELNCLCRFVIVFVGVLVFESISASGKIILKLDTWNFCMSFKAVTCTIQFLKCYWLILNLISETSCLLHSLSPKCQNPNEACIQQSNDTGVCKCKPGYTKQHSTEQCIQIRPNSPTDSHPRDQPTTPAAEYSSEVSGNDETCRLMHTY